MELQHHQSPMDVFRPKKRSNVVCRIFDRQISSGASGTSVPSPSDYFLLYIVLFSGMYNKIWTQQLLFNF